jgi:hypothetical protein
VDPTSEWKVHGQTPLADPVARRSGLVRAVLRMKGPARGDGALRAHRIDSPGESVGATMGTEWGTGVSAVGARRISVEPQVGTCLADALGNDPEPHELCEHQAAQTDRED